MAGFRGVLADSSHEVRPITFCTKHLLIVENDCGGNLPKLHFFHHFTEKKNYINQSKHERGLYLRLNKDIDSNSWFKY